MAYDASGSLAIAHTCGGKISFLLQHGNYPPEYTTACSQILDGVCAQACSCPKDPAGKCCVVQNGSVCVDAPPLCRSELLFGRPPCADATLDPAVTYACRDAVQQTTQPACTLPDAGKPDMTLPAACASLF